MPSPLPTLVLVGGGWHIPATYSKLTTALENSGYEVHVHRHPSMNGARPPTADLLTDTAHIREYVGKLVNEGRTVITLLHSYGGQDGTNALYDMGLKTREKKKLPGGVSYCCEVSEFLLSFKEMGDGALMPIIFDFADDGTVLCRDPKMIIVGSGPDEAEIDAYVSKFLVWNGKLSYIMATEDMTVPLRYKQSIVDYLRAQGRDVKTFEIESGHYPNLTKTAEVVDVIDEVVKS